jgi:molecular chaperone GrpE (heat shock protein)
MLNFEDELDQLLSRETETLPNCEAVELAVAEQELLTALNSKQSDVSLQIEEIYDMVKEQGVLQGLVNVERARADRLVGAAMGLCDLLEDFCTYAKSSGSEALSHQAGLLWNHAGSIMASCGIFRFGTPEEPFNPQLHTVKASAESQLPREQLVQVLQSGYMYQGMLVRKAAVVVSRGQPEEITQGEYE